MPTQRYQETPVELDPMVVEEIVKQALDSLKDGGAEDRSNPRWKQRRRRFRALGM